MRLTFCFLSAVALLCAAGPREASAQPRAAVAEQVGQLFDRAQAAFAKGDKQGAYEAYKAAWALQQSYDIAGNLGGVELKLGKHRDAAEHLAFSIEGFPPTGDPAQRAALEKRLAEAIKEVGRVRVQVNVAGAAVTVNGKPAGTSPLRALVFVEPGTVTIAAKRDGYRDEIRPVTVPKGTQQEVALTLTPLPVERRSLVPGIVLGSVGGAALVTGIGLFVGAGSKGSSARDLHDAILKAGGSCVAGAGNYDARCGDLHSTASGANTMQRAGAALLVVAGAGAVGSVIYFAWPQASAGPRATGWRVAPEITATTVGLTASGTF